MAAPVCSTGMPRWKMIRNGLCFRQQSLIFTSAPYNYFSNSSHTTFESQSQNCSRAA